MANLQDRISPAQWSHDIGEGGPGGGKHRVCTCGQSIQCGSRQAHRVLNGALYLLSRCHIQLSNILLLFHTLWDLTKTLLKPEEIILNTSKGKFFDWNYNDVFHNL